MSAAGKMLPQVNESTPWSVQFYEYTRGDGFSGILIKVRGLNPMITAEMAIVERNLARLVREQMKLVTKEAALTRAERRDFRTRAKKISLLLRETRRKFPNDSLLIASRIYQLLK